MYTLFFFLLALTVLVTVHELGHYWVARRVGVKVLRFSIGFGPVLWRRRFCEDESEFTLCAIPLGGYVRMADEREGPVAPRDLPRAFNRQTLPARSAIVAAGPLFNFALAVLLYWLVLSVGETGLRPVLGAVSGDSLAAEAGFVPGDELVAVDGVAVPIWELALGAVLRTALERPDIAIDVRQDDGAIVRRVLVIPEGLAGHPERIMARLGFRSAMPRLPAVIEQVQPGSASAQAGLRSGDELLEVDGRPVDDWNGWVDVVRAHPGEDLTLTVLREGAQLVVTVQPQAVQEGAVIIGRVGATVRVPEASWDALKGEYRLGPLDAMVESLRRVAEYSILTLRMMGQMFVGKASVDNLSGPIGIAQYAGHSASLGWSHFVKFLAVMSISLGVLNLLPIPVLDGGHLFFYLVEAVRGAPLSDATVALAQRVGMSLLFLLMGLAVAVDLQRLFS